MIRRRLRPRALLALASLGLAAGCATAPGDPASTSAARDAGVAAPTPAAAPAPPPPLWPAPVEAPVEQPQPAAAPAARPDPGWRNVDRVKSARDPDRSSLWQRIHRGLAIPDVDDSLVRKWEAYYAGQPDYVARMMDRGGRYLFHIVEEVEARGLPMELALLPFIESAFNPTATSSARAAGMWQFVPATGREYDLRQNLFRDDRRDVIASTRAALDYLQRLHGMFDDWQLALAAYNWGQGNVQRGLRRNALRQRPQDYASLDMPAETRNYLPKLQAIENIVLRPQDFGLALPPLENHPYFLSVAIERDIDVELAARLAGMTEGDFRQFNPQMNKPVILAAGTPQILLPYDNANRFLRAMARHEGALSSWTAWVAPRHVTVAEAARLTRMDEDRLREVNRIPPRMLVRAGSTLLVARTGSLAEDVKGHVADNAALTLAPIGPPARRVVLKARKGDTVASIARRHGVAAADVARWNDVSVSAAFAAGSRIVVMKPPARAAAVAKRPASGQRASAPARKGRVAARQDGRSGAGKARTESR